MRRSRNSLAVFCLSIVVVGCNERSVEKIPVEGLWSPDFTQAQWTFTRSIEVGTQYEAKRYYWLTAAKQVGTLTIVPRLDDLRNAKPTFASVGPKTYKSQAALTAFECSTGRTYRVAGKLNTRFEGSMGTGVAVVSPDDTATWSIGPPHNEGSRVDMEAVCAHVVKLAKSAP